MKYILEIYKHRQSTIGEHYDSLLFRNLNDSGINISSKKDFITFFKSLNISFSGNILDVETTLNLHNIPYVKPIKLITDELYRTIEFSDLASIDKYISENFIEFYKIYEVQEVRSNLPKII